MTKDDHNRYNYFCLFGVIMMQLHLRDIVAKKAAVQLDGPFQTATLVSDSSSLSTLISLHARLEAKPAADVVYVTGTIRLKAEFACSRCLCPFCQELAFEFEEAFTQQQDKASEDEDEILFTTEEKVDLSPYLEQAVTLGMPYVPLCDEACKGLSQSGQNLNLYPDQPPVERLDPRFAKLADLFKNET
ncbi:YceD family protein [Paenibacillus sp. y28]|uniref:YceD family protein n=1 Tax=Paenibacillus sp. y28 TaxID=3129110 RepID=UPI00301812DB